ncbi:YozE family protein [Streptomyces sp. NBC_00236]|uniref:YozE family protein n=1 Tax=Streptomyces sp. NBC_00236 TaxID=2903639 RepID=UPI002E2CD2BF|nr:YozE family protein [Streptomyces sp. NBC_00236]
MPQSQSFTAWLKTHVKADTAVGDLARDVSADPDWPSGKQLKGQCEYLRARGAMPAAVSTLERAWALYRDRAS